MKIVCLVLLDSYLCSHNMVTSSCWLDFILKRDLKSKKEIFLKTHLCSSWLSLLASWIHAFEEKASQGLKNFKVPSLVCTHHSISSLIGLDRYWRIKFQTMVLSTFLDDSGAEQNEEPQIIAPGHCGQSYRNTFPCLESPLNGLRFI